MDDRREPRARARNTRAVRRIDRGVDRRRRCLPRDVAIDASLCYFFVLGAFHVDYRLARKEAEAERRRHRPRDGGQHLSLRNVQAHSRRDPRGIRTARGLRRRAMHPLMSGFNADELYRLMEFPGPQEATAPLLSRRVFLQSAGMTGLV